MPHTCSNEKRPTHLEYNSKFNRAVSRLKTAWSAGSLHSSILLVTLDRVSRMTESRPYHIPSSTAHQW